MGYTTMFAFRKGWMEAWLGMTYDLQVKSSCVATIKVWTPKYNNITYNTFAYLIFLILKFKQSIGDRGSRGTPDVVTIKLWLWEGKICWSSHC